MNTEKNMNNEQLHQLLYEAFETELGGVKVYKTAIRCAINDELKQEWEEYLGQTEEHEQITRELLKKFKLDPDKETPGRKIVRQIGQSLVEAMEMALRSTDPQSAQIVAAECVVLAETKDHLNWELLGELAKNAEETEAALIMPAYEQVEEEEDEHLYHTQGWTRELWIEALGMPAVLPPPEEERDVTTAEDAAKAKKARTKKAAAR